MSLTIFDDQHMTIILNLVVLKSAQIPWISLPSVTCAIRYNASESILDQEISSTPSLLINALLMLYQKSLIL